MGVPPQPHDVRLQFIRYGWQGDRHLAGKETLHSGGRGGGGEGGRGRPRHRTGETRSAGRSHRRRLHWQRLPMRLPRQKQETPRLHRPFPVIRTAGLRLGGAAYCCNHKSILANAAQWALTFTFAARRTAMSCRTGHTASRELCIQVRGIHRIRSGHHRGK